MAGQTGVSNTAALHWVASNGGHYDAIWWSDLVVHFLGGVCVGFGSLWFGARQKIFPPRGEIETFVGVIRLRYEKGIPMWMTLSVVTVGIGVTGPIWELLEVIGWTWIGVPLPSNYITDTLADLLADLLGAITAWQIAHRYWIA